MTGTLARQQRAGNCAEARRTCMTLRVCIPGITGWTGSAIAPAVEAADDLELVGGVARSDPDHHSTVAEALTAAPADVLVDFTHASAGRDNVLAALEHGANVVIGSRGVSAGRLHQNRPRRRGPPPRGLPGRDLPPTPPP